MRKNKVDVITLGCSKNLVDSEHLLRIFSSSGYQVAHDPRSVNGEIVVINTCGFIEAAREESINMILSVLQAKKSGRIGKVFVMGCLSQRYRQELQEELPEVDAFYGKFDWKRMVKDLGKAYHHFPTESIHLTTPQHYAYVKISEGCNRHCAYCSIPLMTGRHVSREMEDIISEVQRLTREGVKEIQLIAQDLTYYGRDLYGRALLPKLVERLCQETDMEWLRLHYGYPHEFPMDLLRVMREQDKVCKYLDIALQHISDPMLERMKRHVSKAETYDLIARLREEVPGIFLRTTLMVGHPGETEQDYAELCDFVRQIRFERMGAFMYSHEEGTYGYRHYEDNIPVEVKQTRLDTLMEIQEDIAFATAQAQVGKIEKVIIDRADGDLYVGRTQYDSPDVDPEVLIDATGESLKLGTFYRTRIVGTQDYDLLASLV